MELILEGEILILGFFEDIPMHMYVQDLSIVMCMFCISSVALAAFDCGMSAGGGLSEESVASCVCVWKSSGSVWGGPCTPPILETMGEVGELEMRFQRGDDGNRRAVAGCRETITRRTGTLGKP